MCRFIANLYTPFHTLFVKKGFGHGILAGCDPEYMIGPIL